MNWERFEHPGNEGSSWTMLAFDAVRQIGGYVGPSSWTDGKMRAYRGSVKTGTLLSRDFDNEDACRAFIDDGRCA